tara:strand:+ start:312 stop:515 length:204 start_codon:yes stop_codon:yes gene_type:complete
MKNNLKMIAIIIFGIIILSIFRVKYGDYNLNKTISACVVAKKQTSEKFNYKKAKDFCEKEIRKKQKD